MWFSYYYPQERARTRVILPLIREDLVELFHTEHNVSLETVMNNVNKRHISNLFVLRVVDDYFTEHYNFKWFDNVVVLHDNMEQREDLLGEHPPWPSLVQVNSRVWPFYESRVWPTDDVYSAIAVWFHLLQTKHGGVIMEYDINETIDEVIGDTSCTSITPSNRYAPRDQSFALCMC